MALKENIENLKLQIEEMEINPKEESILDLDLSMHDEGGGGMLGLGEGYQQQPRIVKVVRSSNFRGPEELEN